MKHTHRIAIAAFLGTGTIPLSAQEASEPDAIETLAPLVVTGERSERTISETASSLLLFSGEDLDILPGPDSVNQLMEYAPNVVGGTGNSGPTIRGIDTAGVLTGVDAALGGSRPRTSIRIDGRPVSYDEFIYGSAPLWDVNRVEIYRTPQTTTNGVNSVAGATFVLTNDPVFEHGSAFRTFFGNHDTRSVSGMVNIPIIKDKLAVRFAADWLDQESWIKLATPGKFGKDQKEKSTLSLRGKLLWEPSNIPLVQKLTVQYNNQTMPQTEVAALPYRNRINTDPGKAVFDVDSTNIMSDTEWTFSDLIRLRNQFVWSDYERERFTSVGQGTGVIDGYDALEEIYLDFGQPGEKLTGLAGLSLRKTDQDEDIDLADFGLGTGIFTDEKTSAAFFGETRWRLQERFELTLGARLQTDNQDRDGGFVGLPGNYDKTFDAFLPKAVLTYEATEDFTAGFQAQKAYNPGGTTISFNTGNPDFFDEENLWNYELFTRWQNVDRTVSVNANVFYTRFSDLQLFTNTLVGGAPETTIDNADQASSYGAEISVDAQITDYLRLTGGVGLLRTRIDEFGASLDPIVGKEFAKAPSLTATIGATVSITEKLGLSGIVRYVDNYYSDNLETSAQEVDSRVVMDMQLTYDQGPFKAFVYANNLFDNFYVVQDFGGIADVGAPREIGVGVSAEF